MVSKQDAYYTLGLKSGVITKDVVRKYKELALEWYPQKHNYSALANQKFKEISQAYVALVKGKVKRDENMSMTEMLDLFQKVFFGDVISKQESGSDSDSDYEDSDSDSSYYEGSPGFLESLSGIVAALNYEEEKNKSTLKAEKAMQNTKELIADEEKEKRKAAKRKAKKKRRKLKKQQEKASSHKADDETPGSQPRANDSNASASEVEEEGLDPNSAFVAVAVSKTKVTTQTQPKQEIKYSCTNGNDRREENVQSIHPQVLQSRELAIRGNMMANIGEYQCAIGLFTDSIKLDPTEFKYFCNRSYCYHQLDQFDRALKDAEKAITLQPTWPKGYFRKGQALTGLQKYPEAETCFRKVLVLDKNCNEAIQELKRTQTCQLMEMGFSQQQAESALEDHVNMQEATEALLSGAYNFSTPSNGHSQMLLQQQSEESEIYISDEEDQLPTHAAPVCQTAVASSRAPAAVRTTTYATISNPASAPTSTSARTGPLRSVAHLAAPTKQQISAIAKAGGGDFKMDSRNPEGRTSLWVGNVKGQVTEKLLTTLFSKYGELNSIRLLPDRHCAFVNYKDRNAAGKAMMSLQGYECCGENLLIRFPDKVHTVGQAFVMKKKGVESKPAEVKEKLKGPVAGDECFFWRTTGCSYGSDCYYRHVREHKGIDNKFK